MPSSSTQVPSRNMQGTDKRTLYVGIRSKYSLAGGLSQEVDRALLETVFIPFGEIQHIEIPLNAEGEHKGFCFVSFENQEDAADALDNMHLSEMFGRTLKVNYSKPYNPIDTGPKKAVWDDDEYRKKADDNEGEAEAAQESAYRWEIAVDAITELFPWLRSSHLRRMK